MAVPRKETAFSVSRGEPPPPRKTGTVSSDNLVGCGGREEKHEAPLSSFQNPVVGGPFGALP